MGADAASADTDVYEKFLQKVAYRCGAPHDHIQAAPSVASGISFPALTGVRSGVAAAE